MAWATQNLIGSAVGPLRGLMDTGVYGVNPYAVPPSFLTVCKNAFLHQDGGVSGRPGRTTINPATVKTGVCRFLDVYYRTATDSRLIILKGSELVEVNRSTGAETVIASGLSTSGRGHGCHYGVSGANGLYVFVNGVDAPVTWNGTTAGTITGLPGDVTQPSLVVNAGNRLMVVKNNVFAASVVDATLASANDWDTDLGAVIAWVGPKNAPVQKITNVREWGWFVLLWTAEAMYRVDSANPSDFDKVMGVGCVNEMASVEVDGVLHWVTGADVVKWAEGMPAVESLTRIAGGIETIGGRFRNPANNFSEAVLCLDKARRLLLMCYRDSGASENNRTMAYSLANGAWSEWTHGATHMALADGPQDVQAPVVYGAQLGGTIWSLSDTTPLLDDGVAIELDIRTHHLRGVQDEVKVKDVFVSFDTNSLGEMRVNVMLDNVTELSSQDVSCVPEGVGIYGTGTYGTSTYGGGNLQWKRVPQMVQKARGFLVAVRFRKNDGKKFRLVHATVEAKGVDAGRRAI